MKRIDQSLRKIGFIDWILHLVGFHLIRQSNDGTWYCRLCGKVFKDEA